MQPSASSTSPRNPGSSSNPGDSASAGFELPRGRTGGFAGCESRARPPKESLPRPARVGILRTNIPVNSDKPNLWKDDIVKSVDLYNDWFIRFAPKAYRDTRVETTEQVETALQQTDNLANISPEVLRTHPTVLPMLRMATAPPIARDRLIGLSGVSPNLVRSMELDKRIPQRMNASQLIKDLRKIGTVISKLADKDILLWLDGRRKPSRQELHRAATIMADRLCGAVADPIIRNAQERRQLAKIKEWLQRRDYSPALAGSKMRGMKPGSFTVHLNVPIQLTSGTEIAIPVEHRDCAASFESGPITVVDRSQICR